MKKETNKRTNIPNLVIITKHPFLFDLSRIKSFANPFSATKDKKNQLVSFSSIFRLIAHKVNYIKAIIQLSLHRSDWVKDQV